MISIVTETFRYCRLRLMAGLVILWQSSGMKSLSNLMIGTDHSFFTELLRGESWDTNLGLASSSSVMKRVTVVSPKNPAKGTFRSMEYLKPSSTTFDGRSLPAEQDTVPSRCALTAPTHRLAIGHS